MENKLKRLIKSLHSKGLDAAIVKSHENLGYLTGAGSGHEGLLFVTPKECYFIAMPDYYDQIRHEIHVETLRSTKPFQTLLELFKKLKVRKCGFEEDVWTVSGYERLKHVSRKMHLVPIASLFRNLREIKWKDEIDIIRRASLISSYGFDFILPYLRHGIEEREVVIKLEHFLKSLGAESFPYPIVVASGERSAWPMWAASHKKVRKGDMVLLRWGVTFKGYCAELSRTVFIGKATERQRDIFRSVFSAQERVLGAIRPNMKCSLLDKTARSYLQEKGYANYFTNGLGHGVGRSLTENPDISEHSDEKVKPGMVLSVAPAVYIPGYGGACLQDMVHVTRDGNELLTKASKELMEL